MPSSPTPLYFLSRPSPNWAVRPPHTVPRYIVIHYTDTADMVESLNLLTDPQCEVSAHMLIDQDGALYRLVDDAHTAWHAGHSFWRGCRQLNDHSLGVELQHGGVRYPDRHGALAPFTFGQIASLCRLLHYWQDSFAIAPENIVGHSDIAPERKIDPGPLFPWPQLVRAGLAADYSDHRHLLDMTDEAAVRAGLAAIGYDPLASTNALKRAFALRLGVDLPMVVKPTA